ncbi:MAG: hypothetical protein WBE97_11225 [Candidatus Acidiferrales bacterium]
MKRALFAGSMVLGLMLGHALAARAQASTSPADFHKMATQLAGDREAAQIGQAADPGAEALETKLLESLDSMVLPELNVTGSPNLGNVNKTLASLVSTDTATGEDYEVVELAGGVPTYALVANFGLAGPSAVRLYAGVAGHLALVGKIDTYDPAKFYDEYLALVPIVAPETVFMTVAGRTDDEQTGLFTVWYFDGQELHQVWNSDLLPQSSYVTDASGVHLTFCAKPDNDHPDQCSRMVRDTFSWEDVAWKPRETNVLGHSKP